jgi:Leucine-rich repeat (LRR) protein
MNNVQQYIENKYPKFIQKNLKRLDISHLKLTGQLDLRNFPKLEELDCSNNQITELDLSKCAKLRKLEADDKVQVIWKREENGLLTQNFRRQELRKKRNRQRRELTELELNQHQQQVEKIETNKDKKEHRRARIIQASVWNERQKELVAQIEQMIK